MQSTNWYSGSLQNCNIAWCLDKQIIRSHKAMNATDKGTTDFFLRDYPCVGENLQHWPHLALPRQHLGQGPETWCWRRSSHIDLGSGALVVPGSHEDFGVPWSPSTILGARLQIISGYPQSLANFGSRAADLPLGVVPYLLFPIDLGKAMSGGLQLVHKWKSSKYVYINIYLCICIYKLTWVNCYNMYSNN